MTFILSLSCSSLTSYLRVYFPSVSKYLPGKVVDTEGAITLLTTSVTVRSFTPFLPALYSTCVVLSCWRPLCQQPCQVVITSLREIHV